MVEQGCVISIDEKKQQAKVRFERKSACAACGMCMFKQDEKSIDMTMPNTMDAKEGDKVEVEVSNGIVLVSAVIAYAIPVIMAGIGLLIGFLLNNELLQFALCLVFLIIGYIIIITLDRKMKFTSKIEPKMLKIMEVEKECQENI